ncbi:MAG: S41 family peptidase [Planctomycetaceae bacterium]|nr:S41 family peptidase [Planctomycetaceae bacterium]
MHLLRVWTPGTVRHVLGSAVFVGALALIQGCATTNPASAPLAATAAAPEPAAAPAPRKPMRPTETFDAVWITVRDQHYDATLNGVDWNAVRDELRPRAESAQTEDEFREVLLDMLSRLGQSHFTVIPSSAAAQSPMIDTASERAAGPGSAGDADGASSRSSAARGAGVCGVDIALVDGEPTVLRVAPGLGGAQAGVLAGWRLVEVDGQRLDRITEPMRRRLAGEEAANSPEVRQARMALATVGDMMLRASAGESVRAVFSDASGAEHTVDIAFSAPELGSTKFGNLPAIPVEVSSSIVEVPVEGGRPARIGVLGFNIWMTGASEAIDKAMDSLRACDGIVIDLRGNPGGVGAMSMGVAGYFLAEPASLGSMIARDNTIDFMATPRKVSAAGKRVRTYSRPVAVVQDFRSASTSEVFAGGLQDLGRVRVFGETSAGMALPAHAVELPSGDVLMHAVADFVTSKGTRLEGRGVIPDQSVAPTRAALLEGRDPALEAASAWIAAETRARRAATPQAPAAKTAPAAAN